MAELRQESPYPMVSIEEAQRLIAAHSAPLSPEAISSLQADGRVLAADVYAVEQIPDVPKAMMDGYAIRVEDGIAERQVLTELTAGRHEDMRVTPGTAVRIMTGAPVPPGADAVINVEQTEEHNQVMSPKQTMSVGANIQRVGQDIAQGQQVLSRGTRLGPAEIGLLATIGHTRVNVYQRPRVAVLATGDEVVEPDAARSVGGRA